jgi:hypothetical protein
LYEKRKGEKVRKEREGRKNKLSEESKGKKVRKEREGRKKEL